MNYMYGMENKTNTMPNGKIMSYSGNTYKIATEKPEFWEYLLFSSAVKENYVKLAELRWERKYKISIENSRYISESDEIINYCHSKIYDLQRYIKSTEGIINDMLPEAFGKQKHDGDVEMILTAAEKIVCVYKKLIEWQMEIRRIAHTGIFKDLLQKISDLGDYPIEVMEKFIHEVELLDDKINVCLSAGVSSLELKLNFDEIDISQVENEISRLLLGDDERK